MAVTTPRQLVLGCEVNCVPNLPPLLTEVIKDGFDFIEVPLVHPRHRRDSSAVGISKAREGAFTRSDVLLPSSSWTRSVVGKVSGWLWPALEATGPASATGTAEFSVARRNAEDALKQELAWASHLSLPAVIFPQLPPNATNTARLINQCVQQQPYYQVWITVPLADWQGVGAGVSSGVGPAPGDSPWGRWNALRAACENHPALFVALELGADLPEDDEDIAKWEAEPVKVLLIPTSAFLTNKKGFPVLSKRHQQVLRRFSKFNVQMLVTGRPRHAAGRSVYQQYLRHVYESVGAQSEEEALEAPYLDYLQAPLQPLMDNLESQTYETFEKDPVKYEQYRKAVALALRDFLDRTHPGALSGALAARSSGSAPAPGGKGKSKGKAAAEQATPPPPPGLGASDAAMVDDGTAAEAEEGAVTSVEVVVMVVGAGRGPLVRSSLAAGTEVAAALTAATGGKLALALRCFAVEKNPNAVVTLRALVAAEQWRNVTVVSEDMRRWVPPRPDDKADIMVSELLGSFGDNELSPECLDGAQAFLRPGTGVSIPMSYTSHLAPLAGSKLWNEAKNGKTFDTPLKALETAYVVKMHNVGTRAPAQPCFLFEHPNPAVPTHVDNQRFASLRFTLEAGATLHGLAGYFESRLYRDVFISILPGSPNFSDGMFSWFPLYFPLRTPLFAAAGEPVTVNMWRAVSATKVWYEWSVTTPHHASPVHNPNGRSYWIGL